MGMSTSNFESDLSVNNGNTFKFSTATEKLTPENGTSKKRRERLSVDVENIKVRFSPVRAAIYLAISKKYFLHNVNYLKKYECPSDVERW